MAPTCVDCIADGVTAVRPIKGGGPRTPLCATHVRARRKKRSVQAHAAMIKRTYDLTPEQYRILLAYQSQVLGNPPGTCPICGRATGRTKRLAVDHDHETGRVRGVTCGWCNHDVLGRLDLAAFKRAVRYLEDPPGKILEVG